MPDDNRNLKQQKDIAYYSASINGWISTKLEKDKSLLALSAGGIGLLVTLLTTVGVSSPWVILLYVIAILSFTTCSITVVVIFNRNASYLKKILKEEEKADNVLKVLDRVAFWSFVLGIVMALLIGMVAGWDKLDRKEQKTMSDDKTKVTVLVDNEKVIVPKGQKVNKHSLDGFDELKPGQPGGGGSDSNGSDSGGSDSNGSDSNGSDSGGSDSNGSDSNGSDSDK